MNAVDLDVLVPADKTVTLGGVTYLVPGDMPMETYIAVNNAANNQDDGASEVDLMLQMKSSVMDLLLWKVDLGTTDGQNVAVALEKTLMRLGVRVITKILGAIYNADDLEAGDVVDVDPTQVKDLPPATGGTTSTTSPPPSPNAS